MQFSLVLNLGLVGRKIYPEVAILSKIITVLSSKEIASKVKKNHFRGDREGEQFKKKEKPQMKVRIPMTNKSVSLLQDVSFE